MLKEKRTSQTETQHVTLSMYHYLTA